MDEPAGPNADQIAYWNSEAGWKWAENQARMDANFASLTQAAVQFAAVAPGSKVLDVGCGAGATLLSLAEAVGPEGLVTGVDVSRPMLDVAERRIQEAGLTQVSVTLADAATHAFTPGYYDLMFSRFGVMFFDDPVAAFVNIRSGMRPGGRLAFACWRAMADNPMFHVPLAAVRPFAPPQPPPDPLAPGPFAFADPDRVRGILTGAGFIAIDLRRHDVTFHTPDLATAVEQASRIGPASRLLGEVDESTRPAATAALEAALRNYETPDGIALPGTIWLVSATAGG